MCDIYGSGRNFCNSVKLAQHRNLPMNSFNKIVKIPTNTRNQTFALLYLYCNCYIFLAIVPNQCNNHCKVDIITVVVQAI